jgi:pimeloyl-ACP methyl ester carboxylesterase
MADADPFDQPMPVRSADGTRIAAYDLGGSGPDVLFVHATGFCAGVWGPLSGALGDVRGAALDVRGHGRSAVPAAGMDWHGTAADVLATVDALGLRRPVGVGHSMGGASLLLAEQARPGTFAALWCFEPIVFPPEVVAAAPRDGDDADDNPLVRGALRRRDTFPSAETALVNFAAKPPLSALRSDALEAYVRHGFEERPDGSVTLRCRPETEAATFRMGSRHDAWDRLDEVACPVLVAVGRPEGVPALLAPGVAGRLGDARLEEHPDLGHFGPLEDPTAIAGSVRRLVAEAVGGPT